MTQTTFVTWSGEHSLGKLHAQDSLLSPSDFLILFTDQKQTLQSAFALADSRIRLAEDYYVKLSKWMLLPEGISNGTYPQLFYIITES